MVLTKVANQLIKMSLEDFSKYSNDEDPEIAIGDACFLSTRPNSHGLVISEEILRKYAPTILGKFLVGNMNWMETDTKSHEKKPEIFGYFPTNQEIRFVEKDGYLLAYAYVAISKIYAPKYYEIFVRDNFRNTSVEMLCNFSDEENKIVSSFNICGLTSLGKEVNGSCPDANIEIVRFEELKTDTNNSFFEKLESFWDKLDKKKGDAVLMSKEKENVVMDEEQKLEEDVTMNETTEESDPNKEEMSEPSDKEKAKDDKAEEEEVKASEDEGQAEKVTQEEKCSEGEKCSEEEQMGCGDGDKEKLEEDAEDDKEDADDDKDDAEDDDKAKSEDKEKLGMILAEKEETIKKLEAQVEELAKFKAEKEEAEKMALVNATLARVKDSMPSEQYKKFEELGKECKFEDVNAWKNEVLANVATILMAKKDTDDGGVMRIGIEVEHTKNSLWDRL